MIFVFVFFAILVSLVWFDYFRNIGGIYKSNLVFLLCCFFAGALSPFPILLLQTYAPQLFPLEHGGGQLNDIIHAVIQIGFVEEFFKTIFFFAVFVFFRNKITQPLDYIVGISLAALGFATVENVIYLSSYGIGILLSRGIISVAGHMIFSSFVAYAMMMRQFKKEYFKWYTFFLYFAWGVIAHGAFDYCLFESEHNILAFFAFFILFLFTIEIYATVINNALCTATDFTYSRFIDPHFVRRRFFLGFGIVALSAVVVFFLLPKNPGRFNVNSLRFAIYVVGVVGTRFSRFKLIKDRWDELSIRLPFVQAPDNGLERSPSRWRIRGEATNEVMLAKYFQKECTVNIISTRNTFLNYNRLAYIEDKIHMEKDIAMYKVRVYDNGRDGNYRTYGITPRTGDNDVWGKEYPIVALMLSEEILWEALPGTPIQNMSFVEWVYISG
jgi:RsiW-degrading membrane proteinase PrsW (M82 family)